jgi:hypothetical protein
MDGQEVHQVSVAEAKAALLALADEYAQEAEGRARKFTPWAVFGAAVLGIMLARGGKKGGGRGILGVLLLLLTALRRLGPMLLPMLIKWRAAKSGK